jgi:hypothetical protein
MTDLWPSDLGTVTTKSPLTVLREQASMLGTKTKNIVKARIVRALSQSVSGSLPFNYEFLIHAPALDNYSYRLFIIRYDVDLYPVKFELDQAIAEEMAVNREQGLIASGEEEFTQILARIFGSRKTRNVIHAILSQTIDPGPLNGDPPD